MKARYFKYESIIFVVDGVAALGSTRRISGIVCGAGVTGGRDTPHHCATSLASQNDTVPHMHAIEDTHRQFATQITLQSSHKVTQSLNISVRIMKTSRRPRKPLNVARRNPSSHPSALLVTSLLPPN
jgi:hypothetical protein